MGKARPVQTLFYQMAFSTPLLFDCSPLWEHQPLRCFSWRGWPPNCFLSMHSCGLLELSVVVKAGGPLPRVRLLHGVTFLTPILGVFTSEVLLMGKPLTLRLMVALSW
ncbi:hypothetical protein DFAR_3220003 [Desulfarculales bacterium]